MPRDHFKREVERELTGKETEPWKIIYFKLYQSQMPVIERALETTSLTQLCAPPNAWPGA